MEGNVPKSTFLESFARLDAIWVDGQLPATDRIFAWGMPGTGKTTWAVLKGAACGLPIYNITLFRQQAVEELRGHLIPGAQSITNEKGEVIGQIQVFNWMDGLITRGMADERGSVTVINEISNAGPEIQGWLYSVCERGPARSIALPVTKDIRPKGSIVVPPKDKPSIIVVTDNEPPTILPPALQDRFPVQVEVKEVHPQAVAALPQDLQQAATSTALIEDPERRHSIRAWLEFANLREKLGEEVAAMCVFDTRWQEAVNALKLSRTPVNT